MNGVSLGSKTSSDRIFRWPGVALASGNNTVEAIGTKNGITVSDSVTWTRGGAVKLFTTLLRARNYRPGVVKLRRREFAKVVRKRSGFGQD